MQKCRIYTNKCIILFNEIVNTRMKSHCSLFAANCGRISPNCLYEFKINCHSEFVCLQQRFLKTKLLNLVYFWCTDTYTSIKIFTQSQREAAAVQSNLSQNSTAQKLKHAFTTFLEYVFGHKHTGTQNLGEYIQSTEKVFNTIT